MKNTENKKKNIIIIAAVIALALAFLVAMFVFLVLNEPLDKAIVGRWRYEFEGADMIKESIAGLVGGSDDVDDFNEYIPDDIKVTQYFEFDSDGVYTVTVGTAAFRDAQNKVIDGLVKFYTENPDAFLERTGVTEEMLNEKGIKKDNMESLINYLVESIRESVDSNIANYTKDSNGNIVISSGNYTTGDDTVNFTSASSGNRGTFTVSCGSSSMKIKEDKFDDFPGLDGAMFEKVK